MSRYTMLVHAPEAASIMRLGVLSENRRQRDAHIDGLKNQHVRAPARVRAYRLFTLVGVRS